MWFLIETGIEIGIECLIEGHITKWEYESPQIEEKK